LLNSTPSTHPDYESLTKAATKIEEINSYLNSRKKQSEDCMKLLQATRDIDGNLEEIVLPHRRIIESTPVTLVINKQSILGKLFIFNDAIMYTTAKKQRQKFGQIVLYTDVTDIGKNQELDLVIKQKGKKPLPLFTFTSKGERDRYHQTTQSQAGTKMFLPT